MLYIGRKDPRVGGNATGTPFVLEGRSRVRRELETGFELAGWPGHPVVRTSAEHGSSMCCVCPFGRIRSVRRLPDGRAERPRVEGNANRPLVLTGVARLFSVDASLGGRAQTMLDRAGLFDVRAESPRVGGNADGPRVALRLARRGRCLRGAICGGSERCFFSVDAALGGRVQATVGRGGFVDVRAESSRVGGNANRPLVMLCIARRSRRRRWRARRTGRIGHVAFVFHA